MGWFLFWIVYTIVVLLVGVKFGSADPELKAEPNGLYLYYDGPSVREKIRVTTVIKSK